MRVDMRTAADRAWITSRGQCPLWTNSTTAYCEPDEVAQCVRTGVCAVMANLIDDEEV